MHADISSRSLQQSPKFWKKYISLALHITAYTHLLLVINVLDGGQTSKTKKLKICSKKLKHDTLDTSNCMGMIANLFKQYHLRAFKLKYVHSYAEKQR